MPRPRSAALSLLALIVAGGWAVWKDAPTTVAVAENVAAAGAIAKASHMPVAEARTVHFSAEPKVKPMTSVAARPAVTLSADAGVAISEQAMLQAWATEADLDLSPRQAAAIAGAMAHIQAVRQAYEASLATVTQVAPGRYRMEIPAYPAAGDALRAKFHAELQENLGPESAADVITLLGAKLEGHFAGFGVSVQTLEFTAGAGVESDYRVTRTVQFWNGVEGGDQLTTRRETHFPGLEDPSGHTWGPLLAVLAASVAQRVGG